MCTKVAVVTGANKGIGFAIVRGLCKRFEGVVYLTARDDRRGKRAVADLLDEGLNPEFHLLDITNTQSLAGFRDFIKKNYEGIDILVNNAAIYLNNSNLPIATQAEQTLFVNYFSLVSTCDILFPILNNGARVVNMSSSAGRLNKIPSKVLRKKLNDKNLTIPELSSLMQMYVDAAKQGTHAPDWGNSPYAVSKVGVTALTNILQRMVNRRDIKVNAVHPGYVATDMTEHKGRLQIDEGAVAPLFLALDAPDWVRGQFVWFDRRIVNWDEER